MPKTLQQTIRFKAAPARVFDLYADAKLHAQVTGMPVKISARVGSPFTAFGGAIKGRTLAMKRPKMIVQTWRSSDWPSTDPDTVLVLTFRKSARGTDVQMVHANVPDAGAKGITDGWKSYYWSRWEQHLSAPPARPAKRKARAKRKTVRKAAAATRGKSTAKARRPARKR